MTVFEDPAKVAAIVQSSAALQRQRARPSIELSPQSAPPSSPRSTPAPSPDVIEAPLAVRRSRIAPILAGLVVVGVVMGAVVGWSGRADSEAADGATIAPGAGLESPSAASTSAAGDGASTCICTPAPTVSVEVSCTPTRRAFTIGDNEKFGTRKVRASADALRRDPEGARASAREAAEAFACILEVDPDNARNIGNLGWAYSLLGDRVRALTMQTELRRKTDNDNLLAASYYTTAGLRCAAGDVTGTLEALDKSLILKASGRGVERRKAFREKVQSTCR